MVRFLDRLCSHNYHAALLTLTRHEKRLCNCLSSGSHDIRKGTRGSSNDIIVGIIAITTIVIDELKSQRLVFFEKEVDIDCCLEIRVKCIFDELSSTDLEPLISLLCFFQDNT